MGSPSEANRPPTLIGHPWEEYHPGAAASRRRLVMSFSKAFEYVKKRRRLACALFLAMCGVAVFGYLQPYYFEDYQRRLYESWLAMIEGKGTLDIVALLITNNLQATAMSLFLGLLFFPLLAIVINGYIIGAVAHTAVEEEGIDVLLWILPHGIFEIPAMIISMALGLHIGLCWFKDNRWEGFKTAYKEAIVVYVCVIMPLIILAGIIEGILITIQD